MCQQIIHGLPKQVRQRVSILSMESFYHDGDGTGAVNDDAARARRAELVRAGDWNFDHPRAFDFDRMEETLRKLLRRDGTVSIPTYDLQTRSMYVPVL